MLYGAAIFMDVIFTSITKIKSTNFEFTINPISEINFKSKFLWPSLQNIYMLYNLFSHTACPKKKCRFTAVSFLNKKCMFGVRWRCTAHQTSTLWNREDVWQIFFVKDFRFHIVLFLATLFFDPKMLAS